MRGLDECVAFLHKDDGFKRLMDGLFDMYLRYERCFGAVRLVNPSKDEERAISGFFKRDYYNQALIRIALADFERQVKRAFAQDLTLEAVLEAYMRRPLYLQKPEKRLHAGEFLTYLEKLIKTDYAGTNAEKWLKDLLLNMRRSYRPLTMEYSSDAAAVSKIIKSIGGALNNLPVANQKLEPLSAFAARYVQNPHDFGYTGRYGAYFMRALAKTLGMPVPLSPEDYSMVAYMAGLITEGALSRVTVRGIALENGEDGGAFALYNKTREPFVLTLENISGFTTARAVNNKVYIVENLHVFSAVSELVKDTACTLVCAEDDFNAAFICLLDLLTQNGAALYYSGGMDYKGLALADKVYLRYPKAFNPWRYGKQDYDLVFPESDYFLPDSKREMGLHSEDLAALLSYIQKKGKTSPQSALVKFLAEDILNSF